MTNNLITLWRVDDGDTFTPMRDVSFENADDWLAVYHKEFPDSYFVISYDKPRLVSLFNTKEIKTRIWRRA